MKVEALIEDVTARGAEFGVVASTGGLRFSPVLLFLLVPTAAPFKLLIRAEAFLLGVFTRFPGLTLLEAVLMLPGVDAKVDTPEAVSVVMDAPCDCDPPQAAEVAVRSVKEAVHPAGEDVRVVSLQFASWCISGLLYRRPCCCCACAGSVFPK